MVVVSTIREPGVAGFDEAVIVHELIPTLPSGTVVEVVLEVVEVDVVAATGAIVVVVVVEVVVVVDVVVVAATMVVVVGATVVVVVGAIVVVVVVEVVVVVGSGVHCA
jgi:hypothetical protein